MHISNTPPKNNFNPSQLLPSHSDYSMQQKLKQTVLRLSKDNTYLHFHRIKKYNKFGYEAFFKNNQLDLLFNVLMFSKPLLQVNTLNDHFQEILTLHKSLNSKIVNPILQVIDKTDSVFIVSKGYERTLEDLVHKREGLTDFQIAYFLMDIMELMSYLKTRNCLLQKMELDDLSLNQAQKITIPFNIFLNQTGKKPVIKRLPFRSEYRNRNNCPDLFFNNQIAPATIEEVNSWNLGILVYQLLCNRKPFSLSNADLINQSKSCLCAKDLNKILNKQYQFAIEEKDSQPELTDLLNNLLKPIPNERQTFSLIIIHPFLKKFPTPPHILPTTIFSCPPSEHYKQQYFKKFEKNERMKAFDQSRQKKKVSLIEYRRTHKEFANQAEVQQQRNQNFGRKNKPFRTQIMQLPESERTLTQSHLFIEQFVDISDNYGYGYQLNSGTVCFVFNDQTEYLYLNGNTRQIKTRHKNKKHPQITYQHDKLPEEEEIRKKIHILEAFAKNLKRFKVSYPEKERAVTVQEYCRTKYAALFMLTNDSVQVFFNDKMNFLLSKNNIQVQLKNSDRYQKYQPLHEERDIAVRLEYCLTMARKIFLWQSQQEEHILDTEGIDIDFQN